MPGITQPGGGSTSEAKFMCYQSSYSSLTCNDSDHRYDVLKVYYVQSALCILSLILAIVLQ